MNNTTFSDSMLMSLTNFEWLWKSQAPSAEATMVAEGAEGNQANVFVYKKKHVPWMLQVASAEATMVAECSEESEATNALYFWISLFLIFGETKSQRAPWMLQVPSVAATMVVESPAESEATNEIKHVSASNLIQCIFRKGSMDVAGRVGGNCSGCRKP